ncbi:uncharacterized protein STEHIDRAFT_170953 [Stereum hirsutum FP-91666 SS1]|uniref:uncharacterized protein n=1 Tax=Stereum hirsutum (strain FP-91666) TaxID=721885 RepID=UPI000444A44D|nr:uncharacterized protein STEHIDRAFT_170953 [Stereum hirsutum FP-91666 SS1]EIM82751.1 hypothetical protein STEHIDRAFT_170953 [Stereum hirsutum FP-91666 SS1]
MTEFVASAAQITEWMAWYAIHLVTITHLNAVYENCLKKYQNHEKYSPDKQPPRNPNSFMVFLAALARLGAKAPSEEGWGRIAGTIWRHLSAAERRPIEEMAQKIKETHIDFFPLYVFRPQRKLHTRPEVDEADGGRGSAGPQRRVKTSHDRREKAPYSSPTPGKTVEIGECQLSSYIPDDCTRQDYSHQPNPVTSHPPTSAPGGSHFQGSYDDAASSSAFPSSAAPAPVIASTSATHTSFPHTTTSPRPAVTVAVAPASPTPPLYATPGARVAHEGGSSAREPFSRTYYRAASAPASLPTISYIAPPLAPQADSPHHDVRGGGRSYSPYASPSASWDNAPIAQQPNSSPPNVPFSLPPFSTFPPPSPLPSTSSHPPATSQSDARVSQRNLDPGRVFGPYINEDAFATSAYDHGDAPMYHHHPGYSPVAPQADTWPIPTAETSQGSIFDPFSWMMSPSQGAAGWSQEVYDSFTGVFPWRR